MKTPEEITINIIKITDEYNRFFAQYYETNKIDKQHWAALHMGFIGGMKVAGYDENMLTQCLHEAQKTLSKKYGQH